VRVCRSMVGRLEWPVNCVVGHFQKEWPTGVVINEAYSAPGYFIRQIFGDLNWCRVFKEVRRPVATPMCVVINGTAEETEKLFKTASRML
jgi:hypothetical protein